jgi:hypothetical protein
LAFLGLAAALLPCSAAQLPQSAPPAAAPDPAALVHRALVENKHGLDALRNYIFLSDVTEDDYGKDNSVSKTTLRSEEIFFVDGEPAIRTLLLNGKPLPAGDKATQEKQLDAQIADAQSANPRHLEDRQKKAAKALAEEFSIREDAAGAFLFTVTGEQSCSGHRCVRIAAEPKPGFKGKSKIRAILPFVHGTLLIDADSGQWVDIDVTPTRKLGAAIIYLNPNTSIHLHQEPIPGGLWVLTRADVRLDSRLLWERKNIRYQRSNHDFRRFGSSVRIVGEPAAEPPAEPTTKTPAKS